MKKFMKLNVYPTLAYRLIKTLGRSLKMNVIGRENIVDIKKESGNIIYVFWHGTQFYPSYYFSGDNITILSSGSIDGQMQSKILKKLGFKIITGSSSRGGISALKGLIKTIKSGNDIAMAVDGPRGPIHKVKQGLNLIAEKSDAYIVPLAVSYKKCKTLGAWDKYFLPYPYSQGIFIIGKPIRSKDFNHGDMLHIYVEKSLNFLNDEAKKLLCEGK